ncbi:expressed unknown protein [Seminavis robusta]|uniref:Uncharacterized protein n=1 Tax=Seminavis robusta TaxID=568900 RepID=A0A9N8E494_9STRA|nr:expressed unknown protein [Seminavis robusta]|eukprot:Sro527_g160660.1 n/a (325) ;mRNA; r:31556-32666
MEEDNADANEDHGDAQGETGNSTRDVENPPDQFDDDSAVMDCLINRAEAEAAQHYQDEESYAMKAQEKDKGQREAMKTPNTSSSTTPTKNTNNEAKSEEDTTKFTEIGAEQAGLPNEKERQTAADTGIQGLQGNTGPTATGAHHMKPSAAVGSLPFFRDLDKNRTTTLKATNNATSRNNPHIIHQERNPEQPTVNSATASGEAVDRDHNPMVPINQPTDVTTNHQALLNGFVERIEPIPLAPTTLQREANQRPQSRPGAYTGENLQRVQSLDFDLVGNNNIHENENAVNDPPETTDSVPLPAANDQGLVEARAIMEESGIWELD